MKKFRLYCDRGSDGAMALVRSLKDRGLNALRIKRTGSTYGWYANHVIVNWGATEVPSRGRRVLNPPEAVKKASDKVKTFSALRDSNVPAVPSTTNRGEAESWIVDEDAKVFCRTMTRGSQGRGIVVAEVPDEIVSAPLYTQHIEAQREVRVHVVCGEVIDFAQKKRMGSEMREERGIEEVDELIRSHNNGWIFARMDVTIPDEAKEIAINAVAALGLEFGAIDMLVEPHMILEINSAPGLEGTTLERYTNAFERLCIS